MVSRVNTLADHVATPTRTKVYFGPPREYMVRQSLLVAGEKETAKSAGPLPLNIVAVIAALRKLWAWTGVLAPLPSVVKIVAHTP